MSANVESNKLDELRDLIRDIIREEVSLFLSNYNIEQCWDGVVVSVNGESASVKLDFATTDNIPNYTGKTLSAGNKVRVFSNSNTLSDAYIGVQLDTYTN